MRAIDLLLLVALAAGAPVRADVVDGLLEGYRAAGAGPFDAERGRQMWTRDYAAPGEAARSCAACHGEDLRQSGRHATTGKPIEPLAPATVPARLSDEREVRKWLFRNCKWTLGRPCSAQEKGDFLMFIRTR